MFKKGFEAYAKRRIRTLERQIEDNDADIARFERKLRDIPFKEVAKRRRIRAKLARREAKGIALARKLSAWRRVLEDPFDGDRE